MIDEEKDVATKPRLKVTVKRAQPSPPQEPPRMVEQNTLQEIRRKFDKMQLRLPARPLSGSGEPLNPQLPADLTVLTDIKLGQLFSEFCCMAQYAQLQLAIKAVETSAKKRLERVVRAQSRLTKEGTVGEQEAQVEIDPSVRDAAFHTLVQEGTESMTNAMLQGYMIGRDACSRELTRRQWTIKDSPGGGR